MRNQHGHFPARQFRETPNTSVPLSRPASGGLVENQHLASRANTRGPVIFATRHLTGPFPPSNGFRASARNRPAPGLLRLPGCVRRGTDSEYVVYLRYGPRRYSLKPEVVAHEVLENHATAPNLLVVFAQVHAVQKNLSGRGSYSRVSSLTMVVFLNRSPPTSNCSPGGSLKFTLLKTSSVRYANETLRNSNPAGWPRTAIAPLEETTGFTAKKSSRSPRKVPG